MVKLRPIDTHLELYQGVNISREKNYQIDHEMNETNRDNYFKSKLFKKYTSVSYIRENGTIKVPLPYSQLRGVNYIMFRNNLWDNKNIYAFVDNVLFISENVSQIVFSVDHYQTYLFDFKLETCFVEREHCPEYDTFQGGAFRPHMNTQPESLYYGGEYKTQDVMHIKPYGETMFLVMVGTMSISGMSANTNSASDLQGSEGGVYKGTPSALDYAIIPFDKNNRTYYTETNGGKLAYASPENLFKTISKAPDWANKIVQMYYTDVLPFPISISDDLVVTPDYNKVGVFKLRDFENNVIMRLKDGSTDQPLELMLGDVFKRFPKYNASKLMTYPYSVIRISDMKGNILEVKPEYLLGNTLMIEARGSIGNFQKSSYAIMNYMTTTTLVTQTRLNHSYIDNQPNDLPIKTSNLSALLQSQKNQIDASIKGANATYEGVRKNAEQSKNATGQLQQVNVDRANALHDIIAEPTMNQAVRNAQLSGQITGWGMGSAMGSQAGNALGSLLGPFSFLSPAMGLSGGITGGVLGSDFMGNKMEENAVANVQDQIKMQTDMAKSNAGFSNQVLDINNNLSNQMMLTSAGVSHENAIRSIMAGMSDASNVAPSLNRMGGNNMYDLSNDLRGFFVEFRTVTPEYADKLEQYFKVYGYTLNTFKKPNTSSRQRWNFVKTQNAMVVGNLPNITRTTIESMFNKGLTIFHGDYVGQFHLANPEKADLTRKIVKRSIRSLNARQNNSYNSRELEIEETLNEKDGVYTFDDLLYNKEEVEKAIKNIPRGNLNPDFGDVTPYQEYVTIFFLVPVEVYKKYEFDLSSVFIKSLQ